MMADSGKRAKAATRKAKGKVKEAAGKTTGNRKLQAKGKADQAKAGANRGAQRVKDTLR
jgi:uncharacterized protein YjbJ (UPF0337 family)